MKRTLIAMVAALGLASSASAATLSLDTDAATYNVSDTITVTMTLNIDGTEGAGATSAFAQISWDGVVGVGAANSTQSGNLTSFSGGLNWTAGGGLCVSGSLCTMIDQLQGLTSFAPDSPDSITATLEIHANAIGALNLQVVDGTFNVFGLNSAATQIGANAAAATVVPEPGTAAMVGLGLLGLASVGRRRN